MIIGTRAYPADNSYAFPVKKNQKMIPLAGRIYTGRKKVTIVSEPYKLKLVSNGKRKTREFVTVEYRGALFVVVNRFV